MTLTTGSFFLLGSATDILFSIQENRKSFEQKIKKRKKAKSLWIIFFLKEILKKMNEHINEKNKVNKTSLIRWFASDRKGECASRAHNIFTVIALEHAGVEDGLSLRQEKRRRIYVRVALHKTPKKKNRYF